MRPGQVRPRVCRLRRSGWRTFSSARATSTPRRDWSEAYTAMLDAFKSGPVAGLVGGRPSNEDLYLIQHLFSSVLESPNLDHRFEAHVPESFSPITTLSPSPPTRGSRTRSSSARTPPTTRPSSSCASAKRGSRTARSSSSRATSRPTWTPSPTRSCATIPAPPPFSRKVSRVAPRPRATAAATGVPLDASQGGDGDSSRAVPSCSRAASTRMIDGARAVDALEVARRTGERLRSQRDRRGRDPARHPSR